MHVDKSGEETQILSSGALRIFDLQRPMIHFDFEEIVPLSSRPIRGLRYSSYGTDGIGTEVEIRGKNCADSLPNKGEFGGKT